MRLDLFLKASRLCPRRSVAQKLCEAGLVKVAGRTAKSAQAVTEGDEITLSRGDHIITVRVKVVPVGRQTSRKDAATLFEVLRDEAVEE